MKIVAPSKEELLARGIGVEKPAPKKAPAKKKPAPEE